MLRVKSSVSALVKEDAFLLSPAPSPVCPASALCLVFFLSLSLHITRIVNYGSGQLVSSRREDRGACFANWMSAYKITGWLRFLDSEVKLDKSWRSRMLGSGKRPGIWLFGFAIEKHQRDSQG
ncbi:hypothetical protein CRENBAI_013266 [Crenichthys baileyi]|uniref:Uncharacterized protein n=1 Tax=Crenichthys baileyi TaxID=28760 RepID=A0AAV9RAL1_9TELE